MVKITKVSSGRVTIKTILVILAAIPVLLIVYLVGYEVYKPFRNQTDRDRFVKLDTQMQSLFKKVKTVSGDEDWKYVTGCSANYQSWMPTGDYDCVTSIGLYKKVKSVDELKQLHDKLYPIIDKSEVLEKTSELSPLPVGYFLEKFTVGSASKEYLEKESGITCLYTILLDQDWDITKDHNNNYKYGSEIENNIGYSELALKCTEDAYRPWYTLVKSTSELIPDITDKEYFDPNS